MKEYKTDESSATLCWRCKNAVPATEKGEADGKYICGCEWSIYRQCVPGWKAKKTAVKLGLKSTGEKRQMDSFFVKKCPKFERG